MLQKDVTTDYKERKLKTLLNITYSDAESLKGQFGVAAGTRHRVIPADIAKDIRFYTNLIYKGHEWATYQGRVVYDSGNGIKVNQRTAERILRGVADGYEPRVPQIFED